MLHLDDASTADATPFWLFFKLEYERAPRYVAVVAVCCCCFCYLKLVVWSAGSMDGAAACFRIRSVIVAGWWRCILIPRCSTYKPVYSWSLSLQRLVKYTSYHESHRRFTHHVHGGISSNSKIRSSTQKKYKKKFCTRYKTKATAPAVVPGT